MLKTQEKFYLADTSLRYSVLGYNADTVAASLENVVYLEMCLRGYTVNIGKTGDGEIDFVATRQNEKSMCRLLSGSHQIRQNDKSMTGFWISGTITPSMF